MSSNNNDNKFLKLIFLCRGKLYVLYSQTMGDNLLQATEHKNYDLKTEINSLRDTASITLHE